MNLLPLEVQDHVLTYLYTVEKVALAAANVSLAHLIMNRLEETRADFEFSLAVTREIERLDAEEEEEEEEVDEDGNSIE